MSWNYCNKYTECDNFCLVTTALVAELMLSVATYANLVRGFWSFMFFPSFQTVRATPLPISGLPPPPHPIIPQPMPIHSMSSALQCQTPVFSEQKLRSARMYQAAVRWNQQKRTGQIYGASVIPQSCLAKFLHGVIHHAAMIGLHICMVCIPMTNSVAMCMGRDKQAGEFIFMATLTSYRMSITETVKRTSSWARFARSATSPSFAYRA